MHSKLIFFTGLNLALARAIYYGTGFYINCQDRVEKEFYKLADDPSYCIGNGYCKSYNAHMDNSNCISPSAAVAVGKLFETLGYVIPITGMEYYLNSYDNYIT
jgi:hypothetical protein